jgi:hypothetical protein
MKPIHDAATRLMLACVRRGENGSPPFAEARLSAADIEGIDWPRLCQMAAEHGVQPLLYQRLKECQQVPVAALKAMRAQFYGSSLSNLKLARELIRITIRLREAKVPVLAIKGPVLAIALRGSLSMRQFNDLDLLVRPEDAERAARILIEERHHPRHFDPADVARSLSHCNEDEFIRDSDMQMIDLHWELGPHYFPYGPSAELVWKRATGFALEGGEVLTMGPIDTILYLAVHGTKHGWANLGAIYDLAAALERGQQIDAATLMAEADEYGCLGMLLLGITLARNLLGASPPRLIAKRIGSDDTSEALADGIERRLFKSVGMRPGLYQDWYAPLRVLRDNRSRLHYLTNRALRPATEDIEFIELPAALHALYYPLRPIRLLFQHGMRLFTDVPMWRKPVKRMPHQ